MNETESSETKPTRMVRRSVAVALGIICIILIAGLGGAFAYYINDRNNTISALNSQISDKNNQISGLNATVASLQNQVNDLTDIISINKSEVVDSTYDHAVKFADLPATWSIDKVGSYALDYHFGEYSGYASVQVSSTSNDTYVRTTYSIYGVNYDNQIYIGTNGTAVFPILRLEDWHMPYAGSLDITVSTYNTTIKATANVTITYYY
jgi:cell division protein FtsB